MNFEKHVEEGNRYVKELATKMGSANDTDLAFRAARSVLHASRARIVPGESMNLVSQLPLLLKGV